MLIRNLLKSSKLGLRFYSSSIGRLWDRGYINDVFPDNAQNQIKQILGNNIKSPQTIYAGFDPTADSLHVGNLLVLMSLMQFQRQGHQVISLLGGATGLVGDPSGRSTERNAQDKNIIVKNLQNIETQIIRIFKNHKEYFSDDKNVNWKDVRIVNNADWYSKMNLIEFISTMGRHFRIGQMLSRTSVQSRINSDSGISFLEFTYQIFQAYDWLHLLREHGCHFQLGGSDQMGNLMTGHELISRVNDVKTKSVYGITVPIITNEEGDKYGKSSGNAIWLDSSKTSPFSFYQFFLRSTDAKVEKLLKFFTFLDLNEIKEVMDRHKNTPELREAQRVLAKNITTLIHGKEEMVKAEKISEALYGGDVEILGELQYEDVKLLLKGTSCCDLMMEPGLTILDVAMKAKCFPTNKDAYRIIQAGGFYINQKRCQNINEALVPGIHILKNGITLLRVGKRNYYIVKWVNL